MTKLFEAIIEAMLFIWLIVGMFVLLFPEAVLVVKSVVKLMTGW